ncbi:hypothetical protein N9Y42_10515, partial [Mariniblastus sp.]|nr:hypothetical protein [Mariniblastus sp.]
MNKPNQQSVTSTPCECGYLERRANDPESPIGFDELVNEYHFRYEFRGRDSQISIHHCPWCGGTASESCRASLFHDFDQKFCNQIAKKTDSCLTLEDVIAVLGEPDGDHFTKVKFNEQVDTASRIDRIRRIEFNQLSNNMCVMFSQQIDGTI